MSPQEAVARIANPSIRRMALWAEPREQSLYSVPHFLVGRHTQCVDRDQLPVSTGKLVFAGCGSKRWIWCRVTSTHLRRLPRWTTTDARVVAFAQYSEAPDGATEPTPRLRHPIRGFVFFLMSSRGRAAPPACVTLANFLRPPGRKQWHPL